MSDDLDALKLIMRALFDRKEVTFRYHPEAGKKFNVRDLAAIEKAHDKGIKGILRSQGVVIPRGWRLSLDMSSYKQRDDGEDYLELTLDFAKIFGPDKHLIRWSDTE